MGNIGVGRQDGFHLLGPGRLVIPLVQRQIVAPQIVHDLAHALTVGAVHQNQQFALPRHQTGQGRLHRESA